MELKETCLTVRVIQKHQIMKEILCILHQKHHTMKYKNFTPMRRRQIENASNFIVQPSLFAVNIKILIEDMFRDPKKVVSIRCSGVS